MMKVCTITSKLHVTKYPSGEMCLRGTGEDGKVQLLVWSFNVTRLQQYAMLFLGRTVPPEITFGLDKETA